MPEKSLSSALLAPYFSDRRLQNARDQFEAADIDCPAQILVIAAVLEGLIESAEDRAIDLEADGFPFKAQEALQRRDGYDLSRKALFEAWG